MEEKIEEFYNWYGTEIIDYYKKLNGISFHSTANCSQPFIRF